MALNPNVIQLDQQQITQRVFDPLTDRLRTDAEFSGSISGEIECDIDAASGDNIALANSDGSLKVDVETVDGQNALVTKVNGSVAIIPTGLSTDVRAVRVTVTDVATPLPAIPLSNRNTISIRVLGASTVYFGDSSVTAASGYPKFRLESMEADVKDNPSVELYGICASGETCEVAIIEIA